MQLRRHILGVLLAVFATTAPHLHLEPPHECLHFETLDVARDGGSTASLEQAVEVCARCRVQSVRLAVGRGAAPGLDPQTEQRVAVRPDTALARSGPRLSASGPRGPPLSVA